MKNFKSIVLLCFVICLFTSWTKTFGQSGVIDSDPKQIINEKKANLLNKHLHPRLLEELEYSKYIIGVTFNEDNLSKLNKIAPLREVSRHYGIVFYHGFDRIENAYVVYLIKEYIYVNDRTHWVEGMNGELKKGSIEDVPFKNEEIVRFDSNGKTSQNINPDEVKKNMSYLVQQFRYKNKHPLNAVSFFHYKQLDSLLKASPEQINISLGEKPWRIWRERKLHTIMRGKANDTKIQANQLILDRSWPPTVWQ